MDDIKSKKRNTRVLIDLEFYKKLVLKVAKEKYPKFTIDDHNKDAFLKLAMYFSNDPAFENNPKFSLDKGIMLIGGIGSGKTAAMEIFLELSGRLRIKSFRMTTAEKIVEEYESNGRSSIAQFTHQSFRRNSRDIPDKEKPISLLIDDLGTENSVNGHFGNYTNIVADVLKARYEYRALGMITHATSNKDWSEFKEIYGDRAFSRFYEMFNVIILDGPDRRKF